MAMQPEINSCSQGQTVDVLEFTVKCKSRSDCK